MKTLKLNSTLNHECYLYSSYEVSVEKVVTLYGKSFEKPKNNPSVTSPYIAEYHNLMCISGIVQRTDTSGKLIDCNGFMIYIFDSSNKHIMIDMFTAAFGYGLLNNVLTEAEQLTKDYINMEEKKLRKLANEYHRYAE